MSDKNEVVLVELDVDTIQALPGNERVRALITNLDEYSQLVEQFKELCQRIENFEFKFSS